jgi:hypothetical protein
MPRFLPPAVIAILDIDLGKNSFHLVSQNKRGAIVPRINLSHNPGGFCLLCIEFSACNRQSTETAEVGLVTRVSCKMHVSRAAGLVGSILHGKPAATPHEADHRKVQ